MNLSKDVFERRTSTGSGLFSFLDSGFAHLLGQLVSIIVKTLRNTNLGASRCFKMKKTSLPVDVRRSKTPLLKLPNDSFCKTTRLRNQQKLASGTLHQCMHCQHVTLNIKQKMAADNYFERIRAESLCFFWR